ncbi:hormogonium polysaccharide secretion pseudopilin HpsC [Trichocoleus sp. FACHB-262]|uniref:hormogonium polysaccharide secretion pseudopilin HpsC n=1 Tax=Trichocoleus sp. FACHB-262 TaxID=2692869 RepID=UPI0016846AB4|nr:hormogonium polysaccharide secretion pseudopilin HpsC [Trichocoleus sp. FACHB-262]MBD2121179.1 prepilin-type N-terminal cleavage/methylation domain-containing protein [Trichocoleus sp. FACHB-262]
MSSLKFLLSQYLKLKQTSKTASTSGFTLIELLVAMIIAALIIGTLLSFMLNIVTTDRKEQAKSTSEQELQAAIDYIARDLAQAVYIYDADGISRNTNTDPALSGIRNQIPPAQPTAGCNATPTCEPIVVFWKRASLPRDLPVTSGSNNTTIGCLFKLSNGTTCSEQDQFVYSLVAYYLIRDNSTTTNWSNAARIGRFEIRDGIRTTDTSKPSRVEVIGTQPSRTVNYLLLPSPGFMPPNLSLAGDLKARMNQWTKHSAAYDTGVDVLADYVDQSTTAPLPFTCAAPQRIPPATSTTIPNSFYTCVDSTRNLAQVYIRGNALARFNKVPPFYSQVQSAYFPTTQIQVEGRGFLNAR